MNAVRDLQDEIREQDEAQAKMTLSTRTWLLYLTFIEAAVLVGVTAWQNLCARMNLELSAHVGCQRLLTRLTCPLMARSQIVLRGQARRITALSLQCKARQIAVRWRTVSQSESRPLYI